MYQLIRNIGKWSLLVVDRSIEKAPVNAEEKSRLRHFAVFVAWGVVTMLPFATYNFVIGNLLIGALIFFTGSSLIFGWVLMCYLPVGQLVYRGNAVIYAGLLLYMLLLGGGHDGKSLWMFTFPLIVFFLTGKKEGLAWSLGLIVVALFLLYAPIVVARPLVYNHAFIIRLVTVYLFITSVTFWFEFYRDQFHRELNEEHRQRRQTITVNNQENGAALHLAHQQLLAILESIDAHVYVTDVASHRILYMNQAMKKVFGDNREGELCYQAFRNGSAPCDHCPTPKLLGSKGEVEDKSVWECYNPLSRRWYSNFDRLMLWPDGRWVKVQIAFDISERKQWELDRQATEKALHDSQKTAALQRMAGAISHHFNNQLTAIIGNLQLALEAGGHDRQVREYLQSAMHVAIDSSEISMLLSQYTGQTSSVPEPIDVGEFCRRQMPALEQLLPANIVLEVDVPDGGLRILGDSATLEQILIQLVSNSRDAINGRGGRIIVSAAQMASNDIAYRLCEPKNWRPTASSYCRLAVKDSGGGIAEDNKGKIFDPFFTTKLSSRGLGLAVVLGIVKACGGGVAVTSDLQRGCLVEVFLPLIDTKESVA